MVGGFGTAGLDCSGAIRREAGGETVRKRIGIMLRLLKILR